MGWEDFPRDRGSRAAGDAPPASPAPFMQRGEWDDLRQRLERLPAGHPSSPDGEDRADVGWDEADGPDEYPDADERNGGDERNGPDERNAPGGGGGPGGRGGRGGPPARGGAPPRGGPRSPGARPSPPPVP